jgi:hypothetical protein
VGGGFVSFFSFRSGGICRVQRLLPMMQQIEQPMLGGNKETRRTAPYTCMYRSQYKFLA